MNSFRSVAIKSHAILTAAVDAKKLLNMTTAHRTLAVQVK
jgi:hypothetical protein